MYDDALFSEFYIESPFFIKLCIINWNTLQHRISALSSYVINFDVLTYQGTAETHNETLKVFYTISINKIIFF